MPHDLRVKALVRPPRQHESSAGSDASEYAASAVSSDEEWMDSSAEVSSTTSSGTSQSKQDRSEGFDHPRNVQGDEQDGKQLEVAAPRLQHSEFESWEDLDMYLAEYMKDTYQCCCLYTIYRAFASVPTIPSLPETTRSARQYKPRGKGKRKRLQSRAMECGAQINACVHVEDESVPTFVLRIATARLVHNHHLNKHTFNQYQHNRNALEPEVVTTVNELRKAGAKRMRILNAKIKKAHVLDLTAKACLTYETMHLVLTKSNLAGKVAIYDSSSSTYLTCVRSVAQTLITLLPEGARPSPRVQTYESGLGVQVDSYNCGVYVLLAFEMFCGAEPLGHLDKKSLQCLRYRYLYMWMQA
ncbi:hypothetical protein PC111_g9111 [Phytophthora cactorum]|uniref:Ubiquitin-like protease family profile domain-containing protein n=1 Tax=Phytophthora cactorum TaxID=29920 RepID=A0A8T1BZ22_9STRA|nr:hypothetical protein PC111_g9111 [Phytophthora cactorum]KAG2911160.1 hypothetical protein PC115_g12662 [Phytophthora cactorum]